MAGHEAHHLTVDLQWSLNARNAVGMNFSSSVPLVSHTCGHLRGLAKRPHSAVRAEGRARREGRRREAWSPVPKPISRLVPFFSFSPMFGDKESLGPMHQVTQCMQKHALFYLNAYREVTGYITLFKKATFD